MYTSAADGSAPGQDADVLAPCGERVFGGWPAGFARRPPTKNSSPGKNQLKMVIPHRPGLNPRAKFGKPPSGALADLRGAQPCAPTVRNRPSIATNEPRWALPPLLLVMR